MKKENLIKPEELLEYVTNSTSEFIYRKYKELYEQFIILKNQEGGK